VSREDRFTTTEADAGEYDRRHFGDDTTPRPGPEDLTDAERAEDEDRRRTERRTR
jgi:hypothetical protein